MSIARHLKCLYSTIMKSWNESEVLIDRKSKFQARCCAITSPQEVPVLLQELINGNKSVKKASHQHMYAWRTADIALKDSTNSTMVKTKGVAKKHRHSANVGRQREFKNLQQDCQDCGESGAGQRLLTLLQRADIVNVLIIVTRWYGGVPLGSARFRHISSTAAESLKKGGFL
ncbi:ZYBA0S04-02300g1_1 [Zygosaccharomyces bailii CLIB 213]|uniref:ZYBA0S04-02300g1_1 n=1 Tax=Zygosaccharomyces bailii (strain CLIB 213 / ATCC 58445 / CBS 680 / BCRC 21525 / NBRC 1098 / NCYC 1416 / NRRL Y-2227) TaxID=1333698 RepID=A0A8J2T6R7_ZYGB2|nr:ZYBA0S04-02300g1_1 [Zygosaccharomyces bailii CLIB 213]